MQLSQIDARRRRPAPELSSRRRNPRRGQLSRMDACRSLLAVALLASPALADDRAEVSTTLFAEKRAGAAGGLTVLHPQALFGIDLGQFVTLDVGYAADVVSGATASVYQVDAVSAATKFSDVRHEGTFAFGLHGKRSRLTVSGVFGTERDYLSRQIGASASIDLPGRNTTVGVAYTHGFDQVCNHDNGDATPLESRALTGDEPCAKPDFIKGTDTAGVTRWESLDIDTAALSITQNISPTMNLQGSLFGQISEGFQSNPYRRVRIGPNAPQEHMPDTRARWSVSARLNRYIPALHAAAHFDARFYNDTWGVTSGNLEMAWSQYAGKSLLLRLFVRAYQQTASTFFKDAFYYQTESTAGEYFTGDRELSPVRNASLGAKLTLITIGEDKPVWGMFDRLALNLRGEAFLIGNLAADSLETNPMGIDTQFIYGTAFIDSVMIQLGLLGSY